MSVAGGSLLTNKRFLQLWVGQGFSFVGDFVSTVALVVLVVQISGSASAVGGVLVARLLPTLASPLIGVLADRLDRRVVLVACDLVRAALIAGVIFTKSLVLIYVLVFLIGAARTFFNPTIRAAFPSVVREGDLARANAIISGTFSVSVMAGPAFGGLLVATAGITAAFALDAATYVISAALLSRIPLPPPEGKNDKSFANELRAGLSYLGGARVPLAIVAGTFLIVMTENSTIPAEVFLAKGTFDAGDAGYGLLVSVWGGGMVIGSVMTAVLDGRVNLVLIYFASMFVSALALVGAGVSPAFAFALIFLAIAGAANGIDNVATDTVLQRRVPETFLGRVFSVRFLGFSIGEAVAYPLGGLLVDSYGARATYQVAGVATAVTGILTLLLIAGAPKKARSQGAGG